MSSRETTKERDQRREAIDSMILELMAAARSGQYLAPDPAVLERQRRIVDAAFPLPAIRRPDSAEVHTLLDQLRRRRRDLITHPQLMPIRDEIEDALEQLEAFWRAGTTRGEVAAIFAACLEDVRTALNAGTASDGTRRSIVELAELLKRDDTFEDLPLGLLVGAVWELETARKARSVIPGDQVATVDELIKTVWCELDQAVQNGHRPTLDDMTDAAVAADLAHYSSACEEIPFALLVGAVWQWRQTKMAAPTLPVLGQVKGQSALRASLRNPAEKTACPVCTDVRHFLGQMLEALAPVLAPVPDDLPLRRHVLGVVVCWWAEHAARTGGLPDVLSGLRVALEGIGLAADLHPGDDTRQEQKPWTRH